MTIALNFTKMQNTFKKKKINWNKNMTFNNSKKLRRLILNHKLINRLDSDHLIFSQILINNYKIALKNNMKLIIIIV